MKQRIASIVLLSIIVISMFSACTPFSQGGTTVPKQSGQSITPTAQLTATALPGLPKLEVTPNTGFYLDCSHINQQFELYNSGGQSAIWVSQLYYSDGSKEPVQGITVKPTDGNIVPGGHLMVMMEGKTSATFVISFIYKESPSHAIGISQAVTCK